MVNFDIYTLSLFTISMFFLYIFNNYFNKYFRFHKDTNVVVQMLQDLSGQRTTIPSIYLRLQTWLPRIHFQKWSIRDRSLNRQTFGYTYVRIPYIERLVLPTLFTKYMLLSPCDVTNPIFARSTRLKYKSLEVINMSYKIVDLT